MIRNILLIISLIALGLYGISVVPTLDERMQLAVVVSLLSIIALAIIYPKVDFDFKFIIIIISGYFLFGKGFAYLSPFEPIFIGEICLAVGFIMVLGRVLSKGWWGKLFDSPIHIAVWLLLIYGVLRVYIDFPRYGLMVLKDAATIYYGLFFLIAYVLFQNTQNRAIFHKFIPWLLVFSFFSTWSRYLPAPNINIIATFGPHKDAFIGGFVACTIYLYFKGLNAKNIKWFVLLVVLLLGVALRLQMSYIAALSITGLVLLLGANKYQLLYLLTLGLISVGLLILILQVISPDYAEKIISEFDSINLGDTESASFQRSTTGWRFAWWRAIWDETMQINPLFGLGLGADLGSEFTLRYFGSAAGEAGNSLYGTARYPHNVLFTMIGRFGLLGASLFMVYIVTVIFYLAKFIRLYCRMNLKQVDLTNIAVVCIVIGGLINAFLQCTYEAPFSAIPHWVMLAYIATKVKNYKLRLAAN